MGTTFQVPCPLKLWDLIHLLFPMAKLYLCSQLQRFSHSGTKDVLISRKFKGESVVAAILPSHGQEFFNGFFRS